MPELPEVETMRRGILKAQGGMIRDAVRPRLRVRPIKWSPPWRTFRRRLIGRTILDVHRMGKRLVVGLDAGLSLVIEPRMTGLVLLSDPPDLAHLRLRLLLEGAPVIQILFWDQRGLGTASVVETSKLCDTLGRRLGPDALAATGLLLIDQFGKSRRPIKVALLDQSALAGVGNLYASEILHRARIDPVRPCDSLSSADWSRTAAAIKEILEEAIRYEGSTLADGTYRNSLNQFGSYQDRHRVYDHVGEKCPTCRRATIQRTVQAQRSTYFCPRCQGRRKGHRGIGA
jgi:formamidopyrimidine-DNA glycosylase